MILHFVNILPNIYWFFIEPKKDEKHINNSLVSNRIKEFCNVKNINKIIRLDQDTSYWNKHNMYNAQIQKQILEMEEKKLFDYFEAKTQQILNDYQNFNKTLIISNNNTDTAIALFIYLLKQLCNMNYSQSIISIQSKMKKNISFQNENTKYIIKKI